MARDKDQLELIIERLNYASLKAAEKGDFEAVERLAKEKKEVQQELAFAIRPETETPLTRFSKSN